MATKDYRLQNFHFWAFADVISQKNELCRLETDTEAHFEFIWLYLFFVRNIFGKTWNEWKSINRFLVSKTFEYAKILN